MLSKQQILSSITISKNPLIEAAQKLNQLFIQLAAQEKPVLFLISGGSSLQLLDTLDFKTLPTQLTIAPLDERYSEDPSINNMAQIMNTPWYSQVKMNAKWIDTRVIDSESQNTLAAKFNQELQTWFSDNPEGDVIATIGIGPDGHVSGMMPFPENPQTFETLFMPIDSSQLVTAYDAQQKNQFPLRITTNVHLLKKIKHSLIFAAGENKREALIRLYDKEGSLAETPARILREMPDSHLFTDIEI